MIVFADIFGTFYNHNHHMHKLLLLNGSNKKKFLLIHRCHGGPDANCVFAKGSHAVIIYS